MIRALAPLVAILLTSATLSAAPKGDPRAAKGANEPVWPDLSGPATISAEGVHDAALIVGIEDYLLAPKIRGAGRNATDWYTYLVQSRRVPSANVRLLRNSEATRESILRSAREVAKLTHPEGTLWVIFVGHGAPAPDGKEGMLVGVDAQQTAESLVARSVRQSELGAAVGEGNRARPVFIVDACFSGKTSASADLIPGLQPLIAIQDVAAAGRASSDARQIMLTAGKANQFAGPLPGAFRPAFSYLVLGALRGWGDKNKDGVVTADEAIAYAQETLAVLPLGRSQTPELRATDPSYALSHGGKEEPPSLSQIVVRASALESAGFGVGLDGAATVALPEFQPPQGALKEADVGLLEALQEARRAEKNELLHASRKAEAWDRLATYGGKNPMRAAAGDRRDAWRKVVRVCETYAKDHAKLRQLLSMDEDVVSGDQKLAYQEELSQAYAPWTEKLRSCGMATIPGATFAMGSNDVPEERPPHWVQLAQFSIDVTEVTGAAYAACVAARVCAPAPTTVAPAPPGEHDHAEAARLCNGGKAERKEHPINCVDWSMAETFCRWAGKRLPTEEEWEYAARGTDGRQFPWGAEEPGHQLCWKRERMREGTCAVGSFDTGRSPFGLLDMSGNVWEWTASGGSLDYSKNRTSDTRVIRGGSWGVSAASRVSASTRVRVSPYLRDYYLGFRCAR